MERRNLNFHLQYCLGYWNLHDGINSYMQIKEITEGVGVITKQNQTNDVGPNEIKIQADKLKLNVDKYGNPALLHKTALKNTNTNTLFNTGIRGT
jgi:hypothetical protein